MNKKEHRFGIDLDRHGVIEAHAGTGKTWTIIQMVLRILEKEKTTADGVKSFICINEILLVTFTEKAAGELKRRIRKGLEDRIRAMGDAGNAELKRHLEQCLNNLHEALIGTIHGVCLRLLQTWPFETGIPFTTSIIDDSEGLADALRESMRTDWQDAANHLPWALERLQAEGTVIEEKHFGLVRELALKLLDDENTVLDRRACAGLTLAGLRGQLDELSKEINSEASNAPFRQMIRSLLDGLKSAKSSGAMKPERVIMLDARVEDLEKMCRSDQYDASILKAPCSFGRGKIFPATESKKVPGIDRINALCDSIAAHPHLALLNRSTEITGSLLLALLCDAAVLLRDRWRSAKREKGLISFQDMLRLMNRAVTESPAFRSLLRERLRYGIIDEFQDTSSLQWLIFKKIFLEPAGSAGPRIFIVGDPKQSIYSFQGADVRSYLDAKSAIVKNGGKTYPLTENFRSLRETIEGYNAVFAKPDTGPDWFAFDGTADETGRISYPSESEGGETARAHARSPEHPLDSALDRPVQVMVLEGNAPGRLRRMASWTALTVRRLIDRNTRITVPDGDAWKEITLSCEHFAVIVEKHRLAVPFLEEFQKRGIPAVKYKMEGVFQSAMARDLRTLLRAILNPAGDPAPRLAALLTMFFNRNPVDLDPEKALEPCAGSGRKCGCMFHALEEWTFLASRQLWARLFKSIYDRTGVRELLITLEDGKRRLADLRQVSEYSLEKLYRGNFSLEQLVERLGRLLAEEESAGRDENLHVLATGRSCVKVLTMHAAKGLEFPMVFVATGGSEKRRPSPGTLCWMDGRKQMVMPSLSFSQEPLKELFNADSTDTITANIQEKQERRRLLYVALTRAQAMLFVPAHCKSAGGDADRGWVKGCPPPGKASDNDLTPRLLELLDRRDKRIGVFDPGDLSGILAGKTETTGITSPPFEKIPEPVDIETLGLPSLICRQTSYTELSRSITLDRAIDRSEEIDPPDETTVEKDKGIRPFLPGGKETGDALHLAIEEILQMENAALFIANGAELTKHVSKYLEKNGVLKKIVGDSPRTKAILQAVDYIKGALTTPIALPTGDTISIIGIQKSCRIPEMEFQLSVAPHWVHGYMDLVFRVKNEKAKHPWRYFVLDWKSDRLDTFDAQNVQECMEGRHYTLQARVYCHALDKYLRGLLRDEYDHEQNLGGAVYVFLRSFAVASPDDDVCHTWTRAADPGQDSDFTARQLDHPVNNKTW